MILYSYSRNWFDWFHSMPAYPPGNERIPPGEKGIIDSKVPSRKGLRDMLLFKEGTPLHYHMNSPPPPSPSQWWHLSHFPRQSTCKQNKSKVEIINVCVLQKLDHWPPEKKKQALTSIVKKVHLSWFTKWWQKAVAWNTPTMNKYAES